MVGRPGYLSPDLIPNLRKLFKWLSFLVIITNGVSIRSYSLVRWYQLCILIPSNAESYEGITTLEVYHWKKVKDQDETDLKLEEYGSDIGRIYSWMANSVDPTIGQI